MKLLINSFLIFFVMMNITYSQQNIEQRIALITDIEGKVLIKKADSKEWCMVELDTPLFDGDKVKTYKDATCEITFIEEGTILKLFENAELEVHQLKEDKPQSIFKLYLGKIFVYIQRLISPNAKFQIMTPTAIIGVRGTEFAVDTTEDETEVAVFDGEVSVSGITEEGKLTPQEILTKDFETKIKKFLRPHRPYRLTKKWERLKRLSPQMKQRLKVLRERWQKLPIEKRIELKQKFKKWKKLLKHRKQNELKDLKNKMRLKKRKN